jgi:hypothetical protein
MKFNNENPSPFSGFEVLELFMDIKVNIKSFASRKRNGIESKEND